MCHYCLGARIYTSSRDEYKSMVRNLTSTFGRSLGQTSLRVPTQAHVTNPQPLRLNDASIPPGSWGQTSVRVPTQAQVTNPQLIRRNDAFIPPGSSRQTSLLFPTQAHVSNPRSVGLYDALPNRYSAAQWSSASSSRSIPYPFPAAPVCPRTSEAGSSGAQASSSRPSLPSPPVPPSVPTMLPENPPSSADPVPKSPPREQEAMEPLFDDIENFLIDDDDFDFLACSPLPQVNGISNGEQQQENVPPPVLTNQPLGSLNVPVPQNGVTVPPLGNDSNSMYENVAPQAHATLPSVSLPMSNFNIIPPVPVSSPSIDLLNGTNYQHMLSQGNAPLVHATLPFVNNLSTWSSSQNGVGSSNVVPPSVAPSGPDRSNDQQWGPSGSQLGWSNPQNGLQQGTVPTSVPFGTSDLSNFYSYEEKQRYLAQIGFGTVPSWHLDWNSYPRTVLPSTNTDPSSSSAPGNLPPGNLLG
ncbi:hypothetical protein Bca4012_055988 [Brassica carinata]